MSTSLRGRLCDSQRDLLRVHPAEELVEGCQDENIVLPMRNSWKSPGLHVALQNKEAGMAKRKDSRVSTRREAGISLEHLKGTLKIKASKTT